MTKQLLYLAGGGTILAIGLFAMASCAYAATPSVVSVKLTSPNVITIIYSEPVTTNSWDYTNFTGNLNGFGVVSISGSGSNVISLTLSGTPAAAVGSLGYLTIGTGVTSISTNTPFPGGTYNVTSAQAPILTSVSVAVNDNIGTTFTTVGSLITLTFSTNESVVNPTVTLLGHTIGVNGTGEGPYTVNYTLASGDALGTIDATIIVHRHERQLRQRDGERLEQRQREHWQHERLHHLDRELAGHIVFRQHYRLYARPLDGGARRPVGDGYYNGVPLSWYTTNNGATYTAVYTVAAGQSNTAYPLQISAVSLVDQYGNTIGPFSGSDVQKTITAVAATGPITVYQSTPVPTLSSNPNPSYGFVSTEAGTIRYGGDCSSPATVAAAGLDTVVFNTLPNGLHSNCTITVTDAAGNVSNQLVVSPFTIGTTATTATTVTTPASSTSDIAAEIQSLQSQIAQLQSQANGSTAAASYNFTEFLSVGSEDAQVTALQQRLTASWVLLRSRHRLLWDAHRNCRESIPSGARDCNKRIRRPVNKNRAERRGIEFIATGRFFPLEWKMRITTAHFLGFGLLPALPKPKPRNSCRGVLEAVPPFKEESRAGRLDLRRLHGFLLKRRPEREQRYHDAHDDIPRRAAARIRKEHDEQSQNKVYPLFPHGSMC